jgi:hypothetical protein
MLTACRLAFQHGGLALNAQPHHALTLPGEPSHQHVNVGLVAGVTDEKFARFTAGKIEYGVGDALIEQNNIGRSD